MDITIVKIIDIVTDENEETGEVKTHKLYLPTLIYKRDIEAIHPGVCRTGKLYKNVSTIKTYQGDNYTVVGNYKDLNKQIKDKYRKPIAGYGKE